MIKTGLNEKRFNDITEEIDFICDPTPPEVQEWTQTQMIMADIERRKKLTDNDIRSSLIHQFKQLNTEKLNDQDRTKYAELCMKYGL